MPHRLAPASSHQRSRPQRKRVSQVQRSSPDTRIYVTYVWRNTYLTFWADARLPSFVIGTRPRPYAGRQLKEVESVLKWRKVNCQCVHIHFVPPSPLGNTLQSLRQRGHRAIYCGKSLPLVVGLTPVKDVKRFRSDPTIHDSEVSILFVSRNYSSRPSVYLSHALIMAVCRKTGIGTKHKHHT